MNFAVIENNVVTNIIVADTLEIAQTVTGQTCVEYTEAKPAGIGWTYDKKINTFVKPITKSSTDTVE